MQKLEKEKKKLKYQVLGRRVLVRVKKFSKEEVKKKTEFVEGSSLIHAPQKDNLTEEVRKETTTQTLGEIVDFGELFWKNDDGSSLGGTSPKVKIGDSVRFQRYGAYRLNPDFKDDTENFEYWVVEDKDLLAIEL